MSHRKALRDAARTAMEAAPYFAGWESIRQWSQVTDADSLPAFTVATPQERSASAAKDTLQRSVELTVSMKREGGADLEDLMDEDAMAAEIVVMAAVAALQPLTFYAEPSSTRTQVAGDGRRRIGSIDVVITCQVMTDLA